MSAITRQVRVPWSRRLSLLIACTAVFGMAPRGDGTGKTWNFESDEPGKIANGFTNEAGQWEVAKDGDNHVLFQKAKNDDATPIAHLSSPVYRGCHSSFPWFARRCDDSNTPQFDGRPMGAVSVLRGGFALELSSCAERSRRRSALLLRRPGPIL